MDINKILNQLRKFIFQNSVINLLTAIIIGNAFADFIKSIISDIIFPLIFSLFGNLDVKDLYISLGENEIFYGKTLDLLITLIISTLTLYFILIHTFNETIEDIDKESGKKQIELIQNVIDEKEKKSWKLK
jgi:large conductance mechanosensitive channel